MQLPRIFLWSLFRNDSGNNLRNYQNRIYNLAYPSDLIRIYAIEGDSEDSTWADLIKWSQEDKRVVALKRDTGLPRQSFTPHPVRLKTLAWVGNQGIRRVVSDALTDPSQIPNSYGLLVESDLIFEPGLIHQLVTRVPEKGIIAPMVWMHHPNGAIVFYDLWGFRFMDGSLFPQHRPSWFASYFFNEARHLNGDGPKHWKDPFEVQSVGSCVLMPMQGLVDGVRYTDDKAIRGICEGYRTRGYKVYVAPDVDIIHPYISDPYDEWRPKLDQKDE